MSTSKDSCPELAPGGAIYGTLVALMIAKQRDSGPGSAVLLATFNTPSGLRSYVVPPDGVLLAALVNCIWTNAELAQSGYATPPVLRIMKRKGKWKVESL